jgi:hypothetical protein
MRAEVAGTSDPEVGSAPPRKRTQPGDPGPVRPREKYRCEGSRTTPRLAILLPTVCFQPKCACERSSDQYIGAPGQPTVFAFWSSCEDRASHMDISATLQRNNVQSEFLPCLAHAIIETQQLQSHDGGAGHQRRSEMNRIERSNRFGGKRLPRALHNLRRNA